MPILMAMGGLTFSPVLIYQFGILVFTAAGWGYWVWLGCRVYQRPGRYGWLWSGLTGFAANALFLQAMVYADLPLGYSAWYGLIVASGGIGALGWRWVKAEWRPSFRTRRELLMMMALGIATVALQGWALWRVGAGDYYGRGKYDLATYVQTAQFLSDEPYSLEPENIGLQPWLVRGLTMKQSRLTQSVVHGYLAVISRTDSQRAYGILSIFYTMLPALCAFALLRMLSLGRWAAWMGALWIAWLPATSHIHLENFFSQITVLFVFPALAGLWLESRGPSRLIVISSAILTAFLHGGYTEYFLLGWGLLFFIMLMAPGLSLRQKTFWYPAILAGSLLLNPYYSFISFEYVRAQVEHVTNPTFLAELAMESGTWRGLVFNFFDFSGLSERASVVIAGTMALAGCCGCFSGRRRCRFLLGILLAPVGAIAVMLAAKELPKYPFAKLTASFAPIFAIMVSLGVYCVCARLLGLRFQRASRATAVIMAMLALFSAVGTWRQQQEVIGNGYFLSKINTESMKAARHFMVQNPSLTYIIGGTDPLGAAWLCYYARASDVYLLNNAIGDIGLYSEMFWCRRVPAGLRSFVYVDEQGVISTGPLVPSPSLEVINPQWIMSQGLNYIYGSGQPMKLQIRRHDQQPDLMRRLLEFTVTCDSAAQSRVFRWRVGTQTGEVVFSSHMTATIPLELKSGVNECTVVVQAADDGRSVPFFLQKMDLSERP
jgi:hypothetical protein